MLSVQPRRIVAIAADGTCGHGGAFACTSEPMGKAIDAKGTTGRLNVEVPGKVFVGKLDRHTRHHAH
jgi:hypothetical protein